MLAVAGVVDGFDELLGLHFAGAGFDRHFPAEEIGVRRQNSLDLLERLLDRVAALLSDHAFDFEDEDVFVFGKRSDAGARHREKPAAARLHVTIVAGPTLKSGLQSTACTASTGLA